MQIFNIGGNANMNGQETLILATGSLLSHGQSFYRVAVCLLWSMGSRWIIVR